MVKTRDFVTFERLPAASEQGNRNGVLFPEKINGLYCRFDRPFGNPHTDSAGIWISYSPDLIHWGQSKAVMMPRKGGWWDNFKIGGGAVPIKTDRGWLNIYHGTTKTCSGILYFLGVALHDLEDPSIVISRGEDAVLWPEHPYEQNGRVPNVVFTCNAILEEDETVRIYYGAADTCIGLAEAKLDDLIDACFSKNRLRL
jgi:beta-1,4-mannooligosaccharide/beta-1,4-mannosyl-N-acetylglucosamine phosphorylase